MSEPALSCVELEPPQAANATVIWLHGLGADGHDFEPVVPELRQLGAERTRFVFPHAPRIPVTINQGYVMRAWYDIIAPSIDARPDAAGIRRSQGQLLALIEREEARSMPAERIVVAGFSQGGVIALHTALRYPRRLAGIMALSTYLPLADDLAREVSQANQHLPVFMGHGLDDPLVPLGLAEQARSQLTAFGAQVEWHSYPMPHSVCAAEIANIGTWLNRVLPPEPG